MPQAPRHLVDDAPRGLNDPRDTPVLSVLLFPPRCLAVCQAPSRPSGGIRRRSAGKPVRIPGNGPSDAWHIHRHRLHKRLRRSGKWLKPFRCRVPCKLRPVGRSGRSPYRERCSAPSVLDCLPAGRKLRNDHRFPHSRYRLRCRIETVDAPWSSPGKMGKSIARKVQTSRIWLGTWQAKGKLPSRNGLQSGLVFIATCCLDLNGLSSSKA
jgi:hypothetical protein